MDRARFEELVRRALTIIPIEIRLHLENIDIIVEDHPNYDQLRGSSLGDSRLLGIYEGIPLTERYGYDMVLPDKITLFQKPIEDICADEKEVITEIQDTIIHEIAHHFGIDDETLEQAGI